MKKLFEIYQTWTFSLLLLFFSGVELVAAVTEQFGWLPAVILLGTIFLFSLVTGFLCLLCVLSDWEVPRPWALYSVGIAAALSTAMTGTVFMSVFIDISAFARVLRGDGYMIVGLLSLAAYAYDRFLYVREGAR